MPTTTVRWVNALNFVGVDSTNHSVVMSGGDQGIGVSPSQLVLIAVSACSGIDVVMILEKKRMPVERLEIIATGEHADEYPKAFKKIHLLYRLQGRDLTAKGVEQAISLSEDKYCSVAATLRGVADITSAYEILPAT